MRKMSHSLIIIISNSWIDHIAMSHELNRFGYKTMKIRVKSVCRWASERPLHARNACPIHETILTNLWRHQYTMDLWMIVSSFARPTHFNVNLHDLIAWFISNVWMNMASFGLVWVASFEFNHSLGGPLITTYQFYHRTFQLQRSMTFQCIEYFEMLENIMHTFRACRLNQLGGFSIEEPTLDETHSSYTRKC